MLKAIGHGFSNLASFDGRDARQAFWFWVLFLYIVTTVLSMVVTMPMTMQTMMTGVQQGIAQAGSPDRAAADLAARTAIMDSMTQYLGWMVWLSIATTVILIVGLAASFVRRLHDSGLPGWWALLPVGLQAYSASTIPGQIDRMQASILASMSGDPVAAISTLKGAFGAGPVAAWLAILIVIVLGVRKSTPGPNRYGAAPFVA